jgi:hypothetical protein
MVGVEWKHACEARENIRQHIRCLGSSARRGDDEHKPRSDQIQVYKSSDRSNNGSALDEEYKGKLFYCLICIFKE